MEISVADFSAPIGASFQILCTPSGRLSVLCNKKTQKQSHIAYQSL